MDLTRIPSQTTVARLTVHATDAGLSPVALRLRAERRLGQVDLRPPGLPPGGVFIVRAVRTQGELGDANWEGRLRQHLADLYHSAARPAFGPVMPSAQAVVFADQGEMLACLTRDIIAGLAW